MWETAIEEMTIAPFAIVENGTLERTTNERTVAKCAVIQARAGEVASTKEAVSKVRTLKDVIVTFTKWV